MLNPPRFRWLGGAQKRFSVKRRFRMTMPRVLVVDDDDGVRMMLQEGLQREGFEVVAASNVSAALKHIATEKFDVLLSDLHMPLAGDGFTVVSAMRHTHPDALTVVLSGYPALSEAMAAILSQADEILVKPFQIGSIKELIRTRLVEPRPIKRVKVESVASILERESEITIQNWLDLVEEDAELTCISLNRHQRTGHLPKLLRDLVLRLRLDTGLPAPISMAARDHGEMRREQGYTVPMVVEESRILQVSIFRTLQRNLRSVDFSRVLLDVVTIADEVDSQLKQAMLSYVSPTVVSSTVILKPRVFGLVG
jgi:DNA-binding response OmpR family regulator